MNIVNKKNQCVILLHDFKGHIRTVKFYYRVRLCLFICIKYNNKPAVNIVIVFSHKPCVLKAYTMVLIASSISYNNATSNYNRSYYNNYQIL